MHLRFQAMFKTRMATLFTKLPDVGTSSSLPRLLGLETVFYIPTHLLLAPILRQSLLNISCYGGIPKSRLRPLTLPHLP
jgi:hypothetical protein